MRWIRVLVLISDFAVLWRPQVVWCDGSSEYK